MCAEFKVCGLTRLADARLAESLGAAYLGFIFARSPRRVSEAAGEALVRALDTPSDEPSQPSPAHRAGRVGVFGDDGPASIARVAERLALDVVQLHGVADAARLRDLRRSLGAAIWSVVPVRGDQVDERALAVATESDGILLDAKVGDRVGGTGTTFDWERVARVLEPCRGTRPIILAGGLTAANVGHAVSLFRPDVVDVSSGVEVRPGLKDSARLRAFAHAVGGTAVP